MVIFWPLKSTYLILTLEDSGIDKERERERDRESEEEREGETASRTQMLYH